MAGPFGFSAWHGAGELFATLLYLIPGPGAALYNGSRLALDYYGRRVKHKAFMSPSAQETARRCLWWNLGITVIPLGYSVVTEWLG
jgi:hypothetical protein